MAHGFSATYHMGPILPHARVLQQAGYAVLAFDHRGYGESDSGKGEKRTQLDWFAQVDGYRDAMTWASNQACVDPAALVLWGESFSAGEVLALGAIDPRVRAVIALTPGGLSHVDESQDGKQFRTLQELVLSRSYWTTSSRELGPMKVVADETEAAAGVKVWFGDGIKFIPEQCHVAVARRTAKTAFLRMAAAGEAHWSNPTTRWANSTTLISRKTAARAGADVAVHFLTRPAVLVVAAVDDEMIPFKVVQKAFETIPARLKVFHEIKGGHFGLMTIDPAGDRHSVEFYQVSKMMLDFMERAFGKSALG